MKFRIALITLLLAMAGLIYLVFLRSDSSHVLRFYTWDTYVVNDVFAKFEEETGIQILATPYSSNDEMMAALEQGQRFDLVTPSVEYVKLMASRNMLQRLPSDKGVLLQNRLAAPVRYALYDPEGKWSVPLFYGTTGVAVNTQLTAEAVTSWKQLFERPAGEAAAIGMLDEKNTLSSVAALALGVSHCDVSPGTLGNMKAMFLAQKPHVISYQSQGYYERLAAGGVAMQLAWSGDAYIARKQNGAIQFFYPDEGIDLWVDSLVIPAKARNAEGALKFMEFVTRPDIMAKYAEATGNIPSTADAMALLPADMKNAPEFNIPVMSKMTFAGLCSDGVKSAFNLVLDEVLPAAKK